MALAHLLELSETLAWTLLHFLWQAILVGALYAAGKRLTDSVRVQHGLALNALLVLLALPAATFWWLLQPVVQAPGATALAVDTLAPTASAAAVGAVSAGPDAWAFAVVAAWLFGALAISMRLLGDWRLIRTAIREGSRPPPELLALLERQVQRMGVTRTVRLRLTARISTPGVFGFWRPVVLLPTALALSLPRDQLEALLVHELAHIRRADFVANLLALLARTLLYFHPVVHWICRDLERTRETLCDDLVLDLKVDRLKYARALSTAEQFRQQVPVPLLTATGGELSLRVHRILGLAPDRRQPQDRAPLLLALATIGLSILGLRGLGTGEEVVVGRPDFQAVYRAVAQAPSPLLSVAAVPDRPVLPQPRLPDAAAWIPASAAPTPAGVGMATVAATAPAPALVSVPRASAPAPADAPISLRQSPAVAIAPPEPLATTVPAPGLALDLPAPVAPLDVPSAALTMAATDGARPLAAAPRSLRRPQPYYPRAARWQGVEGSVTLSYRVDRDGSPTAIEVVDADPPQVFEQAALDAFQRWRFDTTDAGAGRHAQVFEFSLGDESGRCRTRLGTKICQRPAGIAQPADGASTLRDSALSEVSVDALRTGQLR